MTSKNEKEGKNLNFEEKQAINSPNTFRDKTVAKTQNSNFNNTISKKCGFDDDYPDSEALNTMLDINSAYFNHAAGNTNTL